MFALYGTVCVFFEGVCAGLYMCVCVCVCILVFHDVLLVIC